MAFEYKYIKTPHRRIPGWETNPQSTCCDGIHYKYRQNILLIMIPWSVWNDVGTMVNRKQKWIKQVCYCNIWCKWVALGSHASRCGLLNLYRLCVTKHWRTIFICQGWQGLFYPPIICSNVSFGYGIPRAAQWHMCAFNTVLENHESHRARNTLLISPRVAYIQCETLALGRVFLLRLCKQQT